ncbi:MAG TPA: cation:proton antiporter [Myxococcales bacterium]|jgi:Kef-type K+ transport system membrane component KefB
MQLSADLTYLLLIFALFVVPRALQRLRLPSAVSSLGMGAALGLGFGLFLGDPTVHLLSTLGIVSLFLFAGLDVDVGALRRDWRVLLQHVGVRAALIALATLVGVLVLDLALRPGIVLALALVTPSTGFILDSLPTFGLDDGERTWVRSKAIATEIVALVILFVVLQSASAPRLAGGVVVLAAMIGLLPVVFRLFTRLIAPFAPRSEFAFLLMTAMLAAFVTKKLGAYYLVGAFVVGMVAQRLRKEAPALVSEKMLGALEFFASFFVPFYFFAAGLGLPASALTWKAAALGAAFLATAVPVQLFAVTLHRWLALGEKPRKGLRVAFSLSPTLVFTLVLGGILAEQYGIAPEIRGGLMLYAVGTTLLPAIFLRASPEFAVSGAPGGSPPVETSSPPA